MNLTVLGVSAGNGMSLFPFRKYLIGNIEPRAVFHTKGDMQWKLNFGDTPLFRDRFSAVIKKSPDVIISHPDCGYFSALRYSRSKKLGSAKENESLNMTVEAITTLQPKVFLLENLPGLLKQYDENDLRNVFKGYVLYTHCYSVMAFGNSQKSRIRLVIVGVSQEIWDEKFDIFGQIYPVSEPQVVKALISDLPFESKSLGHLREDPSELTCMVYKDKKKITFDKARRLWAKKFKNKKKWPVNNGKMKNLPGVYRDFADSYPSTVRKQNRAFNPDGLPYSPREAARIQGCPDKFKLWIDDSKGRNYCLNKARVTVTKSSCYELSVWFKKQLIKIYGTN